MPLVGADALAIWTDGETLLVASGDDGLEEVAGEGEVTVVTGGGEEVIDLDPTAGLEGEADRFGLVTQVEAEVFADCFEGFGVHGITWVGRNIARPVGFVWLVAPSFLLKMGLGKRLPFSHYSIRVVNFRLLTGSAKPRFFPRAGFFWRIHLRQFVLGVWGVVP